MSEKTEATRTRGANFSKQEQILLFEAIKPYNHIIGCKKTETVKQSDKQLAWEKVTQTFNLNSSGPPRTTDNLISCYRNVKNKLKKERSESISSGSPHTPKKENDDSQEIKNIIIEPEIDGLYTMYDSDAGMMSQYQQTNPETEQIQPIEASYVAKCAKETSSKKSDISESYKQLAEAKLELVKLQTVLLVKEMRHKEKMHEIEIAEIHKENKFRETMREKELKLMEIKIANAKKQ